MARFLSSKSRVNVIQSAKSLKEFMAKDRSIVATVSENSRNNLVYIETYGCQMNVSDSDVVRSILLKEGYSLTNEVNNENIVLINTCAIRENAEGKVWHRLSYFQSLRNKNRSSKKLRLPYIGVLGCMAERLKEKLLDEESVDFVCGPDAYRDIPRLLNKVSSTDQKEANTILSFDETYADISPVRTSISSSAFVSIMRGCNNMCSFCVVPFTRGRERSRSLSSIIDESKKIIEVDNIREIVLLGQNVNGYHDISEESSQKYHFRNSYNKSSELFSNLFESRKKKMPGARFVDALQEIAALHPEVRLRFTSPHPKDFPPEVLYTIADTPNICASLHLPLQSGSTSVLERMRRGYSREAYFKLVEDARKIIPGVTISTDIITGFCDETEDEHRETVTAMEQIVFDQAFMFCYSLRDRTHAAHNMNDNVPEDVKLRRLQEIIDTYRKALIKKNLDTELGALRLVLVEGFAKKSTVDRILLTGRTDGNKRVVFPYHKHIFKDLSISRDTVQSVSRILNQVDEMIKYDDKNIENAYNSKIEELQLKDSIGNPLISEDLFGKYVVVKIIKAGGQTLHAIPISVGSIEKYGSKGFVKL
jgi:MiaB/RimO family radical SAM methylthiotransferase